MLLQVQPGFLSPGPGPPAPMPPPAPLWPHSPSSRRGVLGVRPRGRRAGGGGSTLGGAAGMKAGAPASPASRKGRQLHGGLAFRSPRARHLRGAPRWRCRPSKRCSHVPINLTTTLGRPYRCYFCVQIRRQARRGQGLVKKSQMLWCKPFVRSLLISTELLKDSEAVRHATPNMPLWVRDHFEPKVLEEQQQKGGYPDLHLPSWEREGIPHVKDALTMPKDTLWPADDTVGTEGWGHSPVAAAPHVLWLRLHDGVSAHPVGEPGASHVSGSAWPAEPPGQAPICTLSSCSSVCASLTLRPSSHPEGVESCLPYSANLIING